MKHNHMYYYEITLSDENYNTIYPVIQNFEISQTIVGLILLLNAQISCLYVLNLIYVILKFQGKYNELQEERFKMLDCKY